MLIDVHDMEWNGATLFSLSVSIPVTEVGVRLTNQVTYLTVKTTLNDAAYLYLSNMTMNK